MRLPNLRIVGSRVAFISDRLAGNDGRRNSLRFRSLTRPFQINLTVTRYRRARNEAWKP